MRAFIAIDLPENLKATIGQLQEDLETCNLGFKWVKPNNIHLTLKFLSHIDKNQLREIKKVISQIASQTKAFELITEGLGFFPNQKKPRIFFLDLKNSKSIESLAKEIEKTLAPLGFPVENKFKAHITLARIKSQENIEILLEKIRKIKLKEKLPVGKVTLYESNLTSNGPIYEIIISKPLTA